MEILQLYNENSYLKICKYLDSKLDSIRLFISDIRNTKSYLRIAEIEDVYNEIFRDDIIINFIRLKIERVLNPHYSLFKEIKPVQGNSSYFISFKLIDRSFSEIDDIYQKRLTSLLRLFKNIFSVIDNPSHKIQEEALLKYEDLIKDINQKFRQFLISTDNRNLIEKRDKLTSNMIKNLPHNGFYHMTHFDNLESILENGLLSHKKVHGNKIIKIDISNQEIQNLRNRMENVFGRNIQDYVPLYINPLNPMMDSEKVKHYQSEIILLEIIPHILVQEGETLFSDGNAAALKTNFFHNQSEMENINWNLLQEGRWVKGEDSQRIMCSEVLVPEKVEVFYLQKIILKDDEILKKVMTLFPNHKGIEIEINANYFKPSN